MASANVEVARRFLETAEAQDVEAFRELIGADAELHHPMGLLRGQDEAAEWVAKPRENLLPHVVVEEWLENGDQVVALARLEFHWREEGGLADEATGASLWTIRDGRVLRWQPFTDRAEALRAAGLD